MLLHSLEQKCFFFFELLPELHWHKGFYWLLTCKAPMYMWAIPLNLNINEITQVNNFKRSVPLKRADKNCGRFSELYLNSATLLRAKDQILVGHDWCLDTAYYLTSSSNFIQNNRNNWIRYRVSMAQIFILLAVGPNYPFSGTWSKSREVPWTLRKIQIKPLLARHVCGKTGICQCHTMYLKPATACETGPWAVLLD